MNPYLTARERQFWYVLRAANGLVTYEQLATAIFGEDLPATRKHIKVYVLRLRRKGYATGTLSLGHARVAVQTAIALPSGIVRAAAGVVHLQGLGPILAAAHADEMASEFLPASGLPSGRPGLVSVHAATPATRRAGRTRPHQRWRGYRALWCR